MAGKEVTTPVTIEDIQKALSVHAREIRLIRKQTNEIRRDFMAVLKGHTDRMQSITDKQLALLVAVDRMEITPQQQATINRLINKVTKAQQEELAEG